MIDDFFSSFQLNTGKNLITSKKSSECVKLKLKWRKIDVASKRFAKRSVKLFFSISRIPDSIFRLIHTHKISSHVQDH